MIFYPAPIKATPTALRWNATRISMPHVISDRDFSKLIEAHAGKPTMEDVYTKLAEAETDIQTGMVSDAMEGLRMLRDKYGL